MSARGLFGAVAGAAAARPRLVVVAVAALALVGAVLALTLAPSGATDTFVSSSSADYRATQTFYERFGEEPIEVLVQGNLQQLLQSSDLERLLGLEGCLSGRVPQAALAKEGGRQGPCGRLERTGAVKVVLGPGTFINEAASEIDGQLKRERHDSETQGDTAQRTVVAQALARGLSEPEALALGKQARQATLSAYAAEVAALAVQYGLTSEPALNNAEFVNALVFARTERAGTPKGRFAYLFPSRDSALVSVRLKAGLSEAQRTAAIGLIREAVAMGQWHLQHGERYLVTGEPVIVSDLTSSLTRSIEWLLVAVVVVMAGVLGLVVVARPSLLALALALAACALTFGALALVGGSLTLGSLAVLPVLVGLSVDYAIQLQSRTNEELADEGGDMARAVRRAAVAGAPTVAIAALASAGAMLGLLVSPVPLVRGFAELLIVGIAIAFVCALTAGSAAIVLWHARGSAPRRSPRRWASAGGFAASTVGATLAAAWRGAGELVRENRLPALVQTGALGGAFRRPATVLGVGVVLAAAGWGLSTQTPVQTELAKLVPQNLQSLENLKVLEHDTGSGGQIDLLLTGDDLTKPSVVAWMASYQNAVLKRFGYSGATSSAGPACSTATLCPAFSLSDLFNESSTGEGASVQGKLSAREIDGLLAVIPRYFAQNVITANRHYATLAFGIRLISLDRQQRVIETMRSLLDPPRGVSARLVGLAVLGAQADSDVASTSQRALALLISLAVVTVILLCAFGGDLGRTVAAALPVILASGWSGLLLFVTHITLNPMSGGLACLVVAISTELSVLLAERYRQERLAGCDPAEALRTTFRRTGAAVAASAVTAIAGFAVLVLSQVRMLQEFGLATLVDLGVSLVGVVLVLPSVLLLTERMAVSRGSKSLPRLARGSGEGWFRRAG